MKAQLRTYAGFGWVRGSDSSRGRRRSANYFLPDCHNVPSSSGRDAHHQTRAAAENCIARSRKNLRLMGSCDSRPDESSAWVLCDGDMR